MDKNENRFELMRLEKGPWHFELFRIDKKTGKVWKLTDKKWEQIEDPNPPLPPSPPGPIRGGMGGMGGMGMGMFNVPREEPKNR